MRVMGLALCGVVIGGTAAISHAGSPAVHVKKAIADTMTPEELAAYTARLALQIQSKRPVVGLPADTCADATHEVSALPYGPVSDTTVGQVDNFDIPADTVAPTCTASSNCTGAGPAGSLPRGAVYTGTGTAPDRAYSIRTDADCTLTITMDPTSTQDLALIVYQGTCSSLLSDCACVDDTGVGGVAESITLQATGGIDYFIVVDGYSTGATPPGPSGPFDLSISGSGCNLVPPTTTSTTSTSTTSTSTTSTSTTSTSTTSTSTTSSTSTSTTLATTTTTTDPSGTTTTTLAPPPPSGCVGGATIAKPLVKITKIDDTPGNEGLTLSGVLEFGAGQPSPYDPASDGVQVIVEDLGFGGATVFDLVSPHVPGGAVGTGCGPKDGWKGVKYKNRTNAIDPPSCPSGSAKGLREVSLKDKRADGDGIVFKVKGKNATIGAPVGPLRITFMTSGGGDAGPNGRCGTYAFDVPQCGLVKKSFVCK